MKSLDGLDDATKEMVHLAAKVAINYGMPVSAAANGTGYLIDFEGGQYGLVSRDYWDPARLNEHSFNLSNALGLNVFHTGRKVYVMPSDSDCDWPDLEVCVSYADHEGKVDKATRYAILLLCSKLEREL